MSGIIVETRYGKVQGTYSNSVCVWKGIPFALYHSESREMRFFKMESDALLREQLRTLLQGGHAHMTFDEAVAYFPREHINTKPPHVPFTPWHLLEHLRIAQWDILEFIRNPQYVSPRWPEGYWPAEDMRADEAAWEHTLASFRADLQALLQIVTDPSVDLYAPIPHGSGQSVLREILLVADHNAFHLGEFGILRQVMQTWRNHGQ